LTYYYSHAERQCHIWSVCFVICIEEVLTLTDPNPNPNPKNKNKNKNCYTG